MANLPAVQPARQQEHVHEPEQPTKGNTDTMGGQDQAIANTASNNALIHPMQAPGPAQHQQRANNTTGVLVAAHCTSQGSRQQAQYTEARCTISIGQLRLLLLQ